jgi:hypothetical protein
VKYRNNKSEVKDFKERSMKKNGILLLVAMLMAAGPAWAQDEVQAPDGGLHGSIEMQYLSKFIWRGFAVYGDHGALQPAVNLDLYGTGFGVQSQYSMSTSGGYEDARWLRNYLYYRNQAFSDGALPVNYQFGYYYYNFPNNSCDTIDLQELHGIFSFPTLLPGGVVPTLAIVKLWPAHSGQLNGAGGPPGTASGWAFIPMLDYGMPITCPFTGEQRVLNLHYEMVYNDGVSPVPPYDADNDWTNAVFGVSTNINLSESVTLTPAVYYQSSWDDSVNEDDEFWGGITLSMGF